MNQIRSSFFSLVSIFLNVGFGFVYNKIVSVYFGPIGLALLTHYQNLVAFFMHIPQEGIHKAFINELTQEQDSKAHTGRIITHTVVWNVFIFLIQWICLIVYMYWADSPLEELFLDKGSSLLIGVSFFLFVLNLLASSWMVARHKLKRYAVYTFLLGITSVLGMGCCLYFDITDSLYWIILAVTLSNFPVFIYMFFTVFRKFQYSWKDVTSVFSSKDYFMPLIIMGVVSLLSGKFLDYVVREIAFDLIGPYESGLWQSAVKISQAFVFLCGAFLSTIFYPYAAESIKDKQALHAFVKKFMLLYVPVTFIGVASMFVLRDLLFQILFSKEFIKADKYFLLILIGDWLRCVSWVGAYLLMASSDTRRFIVYEIISGAAFILVFIFGTDYFTWEVMAMANLMRYVVYSVLVIFYYRNVWMVENSRL
ncbi:O-antigen translocase [Cytophaga aurantiaca]|uniref:O-antigen translocase n=1 Tax=Cytophaga aurantiaca TaxID=29530 RepID=UPI000361A7A8|nr:O-antigen translocase [Cytophaga aurantiaca]